MKKLILLFLLIGSQLLQSQVTAYPPDPLTLCDINNNGFATFDLTAADPQIIGGQTDVNLSYHLTLADANSGVNPVVSPYANVVPYAQTLFARVESIVNGDFATVELELIVIPIPATTSPASIILIDENGDGFEVFDLTIREVDIADPALNYSFNYFEIESDAEQNLNPIATPQTYINIESPEQTIYVRIEDPSTNCFSIETLLLVLDTIPSVPDVIEEPFVVFDENGDSFAIFDLTTMIPVITGGQTGWEVTFYETEVDAENKTNLIEEPETYENITNPQTMYARTETVYGSFALTSFTIFADENLSTSSFDLEQIYFYPNPVQDVLHLSIADINEDLLIEIFNNNGQHILSKNHSSKSSEIADLNISNLSAGIYFLKITSENNQIVKKLIKK